MYYSFDFAANVTRLCMKEIRRRGLRERKIFRKSRPINDLFAKVFTKQNCTQEDLSYVDIHSVATLMQDALWSSQERLIPKRAWRTINYETCTLSNLSSVITKKSEQLLIDILSFLVELMQHKKYNQMDAYKLGDALGKVVLGPADCSTIIAEKAGHFLTRLIIEYTRIQRTQQQKLNKLAIDKEVVAVSTPNNSRSSIDSAISLTLSPIDNAFVAERTGYGFICKLQGTKARAKYYDRIIEKIKRSSSDWFDNAVGIQAMLESEYESAPEMPGTPYISIFTSAEELILQQQKKFNTDKEEPSPIIYRILMNACQPNIETIAISDSANSYFFDNSSSSATTMSTEKQLKEAFNDFHTHSIQTNSILALQEPGEKENPLKKLNHSLSNLKLQYRKYRSSQNLNHLFEENTINDDSETLTVSVQDSQRHVSNKKVTEESEKPLLYFADSRVHQQQQRLNENTHNVRKLMRKMIKMASVGQQGRDKRSSKIVP